jgi:hypothetical protein
VRDFVRECIDSVARLEVLLLTRSEPHRAWTAEELGARLYTSVDSIAGHVAVLKARGVLVDNEPPDIAYRYQPSSPAIDKTIGELADLYRERRVSVVTLIYSEPNANVRTFSDAFRFRKGK